MYKNYEKTLERLGITSYKVHKYTGVPQSSLSDWKNGRSVPKIDKMQKIADYLDVTTDYLYGNEEEKQDRTKTYNFSLEEATATFIENVASKKDIQAMTNNDRKEFQKYLLEQAELAYLRYRRNKMV